MSTNMDEKYTRVDSGGRGIFVAESKMDGREKRKRYKGIVRERE
jgi:hypothetical protein